MLYLIALLDYETEKSILDHVTEYSKDHTLIIITHRLNTIELVIIFIRLKKDRFNVLNLRIRYVCIISLLVVDDLLKRDEILYCFYDSFSEINTYLTLFL